MDKRGECELFMQSERGFLGLETVGDQSSHEMNSKVDRAAMTGMLDLRDILQLVDDRFDDGSLAQQQFVSQGHQPVLHVGLEPRDQLHALRL